MGEPQEARNTISLQQQYQFQLQASQVIIQKFPCVLGIQQALLPQRLYLQDQLRSYYGYIGLARDLGQGEEVGIFYHIHRFFVIDSGFVWFNESKQAGKPGFGASLPRNLTYALLDDQITNRVCLVINTHLDHESSLSQKKSVEIIVETIQNIVQDNKKFREKPIKDFYIMGDFNISDSSSIFAPLYSGQIQFKSVRNTAKKTDKGTTFHGFYGDLYLLSTVIDHIFYSSEREPRSFERIKSSKPYLSDHYPIIAQFTDDTTN